MTYSQAAMKAKNRVEEALKPTPMAKSATTKDENPLSPGDFHGRLDSIMQGENSKTGPGGIISIKVGSELEHMTRPEIRLDR